MADLRSFGFIEDSNHYKTHQDTMTDFYAALGWLSISFSGWNLTVIISIMLQSIISPGQAQRWAEVLSGNLGGFVATVVVAVVCFLLFKRSIKKTYELYEERISDKDQEIKRLSERIKDLER